MTMTSIEETKQSMEVMQSFLDGVEIESKGVMSEGWKKCDLPMWNWNSMRYRVKPKPLVFYVNAYSRGPGEPYETGDIYDTRADARECRETYGMKRTGVRMIEDPDQTER